MLLVASCYRSWDKLRPDGPLGSYADFTLFGQDGWTLASFFFCEFMDLDYVTVHKLAKKELDQHPAILTSHLVNNPYIYIAHNKSNGVG